MKRCGLYVRVSTDRQALLKDGSLDTQESRLRSYVTCRSTSQEAWDITNVYREEGESGKDTNRPALQRMLADVRSGELDVLLCTKIDRVTRSLLDFFAIYQLFQEKKVEFISIDESFDTSSATGRAMLKIILVFAELERERTSERTKEKMSWRAGQGLWNGNQILGYDLDPNQKGILQVNEEEAAIVRFLYQCYARTRSVRHTAVLANQKGYRTKAYVSRTANKRGGFLFTKSAIIKILRSPVYLGKTRYNDDVFQGKHAAIIPETVWKEVQQLLGVSVEQHRRYGKRLTPPQHTYYLKGLARCSGCGAVMTPSWSFGRKGAYFYYQCTGTGDGSGRCKGQRINAEALEEVILERVRQLIATPTLFRSVVEAANEAAEDSTADARSRRGVVIANLQEIEQELRNLIGFVAKGGYLPTIRAKIEDGEGRKEQIQAELKRLDADIAEKSKLDEGDAHSRLEAFGRLWEGLAPAERQEAVQLLVQKVVWAPERIDVWFYDFPWDELPKTYGDSLHKAALDHWCRLTANMAPRRGLEPRTLRLQAPRPFGRAWTISSPRRVSGASTPSEPPDGAYGLSA